ncbi:hypothetical protein C8Q80DRAFT_1303021 [Daedaleopsis nitida]|nr:hypothetical protein C8Q80DRAFT_1303021 [Daedaleopsis nitida]
MPPSNVSYAVDWATRETSITMTYKHGQEPSATQVPSHISATAASTQPQAFDKLKSEKKPCASKPGCPRPPLPRTSVQRQADLSVPVSNDGDDGQREGARQAQAQAAAPALGASIQPASAADATATNARVQCPGLSTGDGSGPTDTDSQRPVTKNGAKTQTRIKPELRAHKIYRSAVDYADWYASESERTIVEPPWDLRAWHGLLYLHRARESGSLRIWMYFVPGYEAGTRARRRTLGAGAGRWERIRKGHAHPFLEGYVLHLVFSGGPRWVKRGTACMYAKERRRRAYARAAL